MKNLFLVLTFFLTASAFTQKYAAVVPIELPDSAGCGGKAKVKIYNAVAPIEFNWWDDHWQPSSGTQASNLCDEGRYSVDITDSTCNKFNVFMVMHADSTQQVSLDTCIIVMPSAPGMCDGEMHFTFNNILPIHDISFYASDTVVNGQNFSFTNLCERRYAYSITINGNGEYHVVIDNRLPGTVSTPCVDYDADILIDLPTTSTSCNGELTVNGVSNVDTLNYLYYVYIYDGFGATNINMTDPYNTYLQNICEGPHLVDIEAWNGSYQMTKRWQMYISSDASQGTLWNVPDSLLPNTDTLVLESVFDCAVNFSQNLDSAYISSITGVGNGQYEFTVTLVQDTNVINVYGTAVVDTSLNFFVDISVFCEDSSRTNVPFFSKRNLIYHGVKLQSTAGIIQNTVLSEVKLFPNPFENRITLNYSWKDSGILRFEISDITGKIIYSENKFSNSGSNRHEIYLDEINSGMYFLNIYTDTDYLYSGKIIRN